MEVRGVSEEQRIRIERAQTEPLAFEKLRRGVPLQAFVRGSRGSSYQVTLCEDASFECSCPDFERNCRRRRMVCKHISFLVLRIFGCVPGSLLRAGHLTAEEVNEVVSMPETPLSTPTDSIFGVFVRNFGEDVDCPICLSSLVPESAAEETATLVQCPDCRKVLHETCARRWFGRNCSKTCVMCRSPRWAVFGLV